MKRFALAMALTCVLSVSALAGQIPCDYAPPPPPAEPPPGMVANSPGEVPSVPGDIPFDLTQQAENAAYEGLIAFVGWFV